MNAYDILSASAERWPLRPALIDELGVMDYRTLRDETENLRRQLVRLGVRQGQGVGIMARNGRSMIVAAFAALGAGAVVMPIHHQLKAAELAETLAKAPLHGVIDDGSGIHPFHAPSAALELATASSLRFTRTGLSLEQSFIPSFVPALPDAAFVRFTSGTTGAAKGVVLTHQGLLERIEAANQGLGLTHEDVVLWVLPMAFHFFVSIVLYLRVGAAIVICRDHLAETILDDAVRARATFLYAAPLHIRMLAADRSGRPLATLRRVMSVSSRLHPHSARAFEKRFGLPVTQGYGIIEVGLPIMNLEHAHDHPEAIGRPLPGFEAAILNEAGHQPLSPGEIGQLAIRGPGMFAAYLNPPLTRAQALHGDWFLSGDLARRDAEGLITLAGRRQSLINVAGHKVFPEEVAAVLELHPLVARARIASRAHPQLGEGVHAEIQLHDHLQPPRVEEILAFCRERLSSYKTPLSIEFVEKIGQTPSGKVRHG